MWGHSQGGHSAAFAAQLAKQLAPEIKLNGIVLAAPAANLQNLVGTVLGPDKPSMLTGVAAMVAASWSQTYALPLDKVLTMQGKEKFRRCIKRVRSIPFSRSRSTNRAVCILPTPPKRRVVRHAAFEYRASGEISCSFLSHKARQIWSSRRR